MFQQRVSDIVRMAAMHRALAEIILDHGVLTPVRVIFCNKFDGEPNTSTRAKRYTYWSGEPLKVGDRAIVKVHKVETFNTTREDPGFRMVQVVEVLDLGQSMTEVLSFDTDPKMIVARVHESYGVNSDKLRESVARHRADIEAQSTRKLVSNFKDFIR